LSETAVREGDGDAAGSVRVLVQSLVQPPVSFLSPGPDAVIASPVTFAVSSSAGGPLAGAPSVYVCVDWHCSLASPQGSPDRFGVTVDLHSGSHQVFALALPAGQPVDASGHKLYGQTPIRTITVDPTAPPPGGPTG
jgi:hypothetical protein